MSSPAYPRSLAILSFHKIGMPSDPDWETWFYIPDRIFQEQLEAVRRNDWKVIGVDDFVRGLSEPDSLPERSALLTFDDGYQSTLTIALPSLQRFGYPAVVFVPTAYIGGINSFDLDNEPPEAICTWDELRQLEAGGVSVQSHGVTHRTFSELSPAERREEAQHSKAVLEEGLQTRVSTLAFPFGDGADPDAVSSMLAETGYRAAFLYAASETYLPVRLPIGEAYRLDRIAMGPDTNLDAILGNRALGNAR